MIFFQKKISDLFSDIQDASFAILKSIFEKLLFLGSYKGRGKKKQNIHLADLTNNFIRLNGMGKKTALKKRGEKKTP